MIVTRLKGLALLGLSVLAALGCWAAFTTWLVSDRVAHRAYETAAPCPDGAPGRRYEDCLRTVTFTVDATKVDRGKRGGFRATLSGTPYWDGVVAFGDPGPVLEELRPGDRITGTVWRGEVMTIARGDARGVRQRTSDAPRDEPQMAAGLGTGLGLLAALTLVFGGARLAGPRPHPWFAWRPYGKRLLILTVSVSFAVGLLGVWTGLVWWLVPAVAVSLVALGAVLIYGWDRPEGDIRQTGIV
ncbi:hypothetical protein ACFW2X_23370 [Streptomyces antibioticus]|uniref:hypothetical protein n=1 Tax=Streptomyces antibioticus TaxID=1890 RepID=UPI0036A7A238